MKSNVLQLTSPTSQSQLFFLAILGSLYLPFQFNSICIGLFVVHSFFSPHFGRNLKNAPQFLLFLLIGFFIFNAISLLYTQNMDDGWHKLQTKLPFLLMPIALAGSGIGQSTSFRKTVLNAFVYMTIAAALAALLNAGFTSLDTGSFSKTINDQGTLVKEYYFTYTNLAFFIMHPGYFSLYVGSAIFIGIYLLLTDTSWIRARWIQLALLAFLMVFLILLQGRISILGFMLLLFVSVLIYFFTAGSYWKGIALVAFPVLFFAAILIFAPPSLTRRFTEFKSLDYRMDAPNVYDFNGFTLRLAEWHCALDAIARKPIAGHGLGDGNEALMESYRENNFIVGLDREYNAHNQYLETGLQTGVIGMVIILLIYTWLVIRAYRHRDLLLFVLGSLFFISMITESMLERHWAISFFCSLLLYLGLSSSRDASGILQSKLLE